MAADATSREKLGLALSGGGFRAAFFHIGVLARMAETGLLRRVEVLSTVSGGSIVGAFCYLHVKRLLESKPDASITDADYVAIMRRIERDFLRAVQRNLRMRTFLNPLKILRMAWPDYSRSDRIAELYEEEIYRQAWPEVRWKAIEMRELKIEPAGTSEFDPREGNVGRSAMVPILLINATCLNTGHNWRFEAVQMGEPTLARAGTAARDIDKNARLAGPVGYSATVNGKRHRQDDFPLAHAVAASACVPGIFHPMAVSHLYGESYRVQLVDGGIHDNQGLRGILDNGCTQIVISDGSGQMRDEPEPAPRFTQLIQRSNEILMDRIREEQLFGVLLARHSTVPFAHLRKDLPADEVAWVNIDREPAASAGSDTPGPKTSYGVHREVQDRLSRVRTDLDSFTDVEACSLMLDGYLVSDSELQKLSGEHAHPASPSLWGFGRAYDLLTADRPGREYLRHLDVGRRRVFRATCLSWRARAIVILLALALSVLAAPPVRAMFPMRVSVGWLVVAAGLVGVGALVKVLVPLVARCATCALLAVVAPPIVWGQLLIFDRILLRKGSLGISRTDSPQQDGAA